jgi:putative oxidoreductase
MGLPAWTAWLSGFAETFGGIFLAAAFMTRPAALAIAGNLSVAGFVRHAADPYQRKELAFLFLAVAVMYLFVGAGLPSIRLIK